MIRHRNGDADIRALERAYLSDSTDLSAYEALLAARLRAGIPVDDPRTPPASVASHAILLKFRILSKITTQSRVLMAAGLGHRSARLLEPEWAKKLGTVDFYDYTTRRNAISILNDYREAVSFACDCAEAILPIYEQAAPEDMRPRLAIQATRAWIETPSKKNADAAYAAYASADDIGVGVGANYETYFRAARAAAFAAYSAYVAHESKNDDVYYAAASVAGFAQRSLPRRDRELNIDIDNDRVAEMDRQRDRLAQYLVGEFHLPVIKKRRNGDVDIRALENDVRDDPSDIGSHIKLLRAKLRAGLLSHDRIVMAARLGSEAARGAAPEWNWGLFTGEIRFNTDHSRRVGILGLRDIREAITFACDCVERVLPNFEQAMPGDNRPRRAIEVARAWVVSPSRESAIINAIFEAAVGAADACDAVVGIDEAAAEAAAAAYGPANEICSVRAGYICLVDSIDNTIRSVRWQRLGVGYNEIAWQRERLIKYFLGEVSTPPIKQS